MIIESKTSELTIYASRDIHKNPCISLVGDLSRDDVKALAALVFSVANQNMTTETTHVIHEEHEN